jgi:hypothetical protein
MRIEIFAEACGTRVLEDVATEGVSMPMVVIEGLAHIRVRIEPVQPGDCDSAFGVVQGGDRRDQCGDGIRDGTAEHAAVDPVVQGSHREDDTNHAAQRRGQRRLPHGPVGRVGKDDRICPQLLAVPLQDSGKAVRADLLLAFDEDGHPDRKRP